MATMLMSAILFLQILTLQGCLGLAVYDDDSIEMVTGKAVARTLWALPTFGLSEWRMAEIKTNHENRPWPMTSESHTPLTSAPNKNAVFVVSGNHPIAISGVTEWIQRGGHRVVERERLRAIEEEHRIQLSQTDSISDLLKVGQLIGAERLAFVEVTQRSETQPKTILGETYDRMTGVRIDRLSRSRCITQQYRFALFRWRMG